MKYLLKDPLTYQGNIHDNFNPKHQFMKTFSCFSRYLPVYFLAGCIFSSCAGVIRITDSDNSGKLILKKTDGESAETFPAFEGQTIKWQIKDKKVIAIESIPPKEPKNAGAVIFKEEPHKKFLSKTWKAKINKSDNKKVTNYYYNIRWLNQKGDTLTHDPLIQVNPKFTR